MPSLGQSGPPEGSNRRIRCQTWVEQICTGREETFRGKKWVPFAKGGKPFYHDIQLVVNWGNNGEEIRNFSNAVIRNASFCFRAGLAWARIAEKSIEAFKLPEGCIFDVNSGAAFGVQMNALVAILCSQFGWMLCRLFEPTAHTMQIGTIARFPISPEVSHAWN